MITKYIKNQCGKLRPHNKIRTPEILQHSETECGLAALAILFAHHNFHLSLEDLRTQCNASRDGTNANALIKIAKHYGFETEAYSVDIDYIKELKQPVIAFWNFTHYVVINGYGTEKFFINDPAHGNYSVSRNEFDKAFTGVIIQIYPSEQTQVLKRQSTIIPFAQSALFGWHRELIFIFLCTLLSICNPILSYSFLSIFIDQCLIAKNIDWLPCMGLTLSFLCFLFIIILIIQKHVQFKLAIKASIKKSLSILHYIVEISFIYFSLRQRSEIIAILARVELVINLIHKNLIILLVSTLTSSICLICMFQIDIILTLVSLLLAAASSFTAFVIAKVNYSYEKSNLNILGKLYAFSISCINNLENIKCSNLNGVVLKKWQRLFFNKLKIQDQTKANTAIQHSLTKLFNTTGIIALIGVGNYRITNGSMTIGRLLAYYSLNVFFINALTIILQAFKDLQIAYASHAHLVDITKQQKDARFINLSHESQKSTFAEIQCSNLSFHYNKNTAATINNINFRIKSGEHIGIVGGTGSGKSTLAKLLCALYTPDSGFIKVDNKDIRHMSASHLATCMAYVSQDHTLFSGTLYENLTLWHESIPPQIIDNAIKLSCLEEVVASRGLHARVEEGGSNFSGGEKQRIDIARALIQQTPILILDEASSALDVQSEVKLLKNLRTTKQTIIFIAHRLSTSVHCDQIWVMEQGSIIERGRHADLLRNQGCYYYLLLNEKAKTNEPNAISF